MTPDSPARTDIRAGEDMDNGWFESTPEREDNGRDWRMATATPMVRASERRTYLQCQWKWWQSYREGLVRRNQPLGPLWFGTGVHIALADWYCGPGLKRGREPAETWQEYAAGALAFVKTTDPEEQTVAKYEDAGSLGVAMLEGYRRLYGTDDHIHVIAPERTGYLDIPWPKQEFWDVAEGTPGMARQVWTWDLVGRDLRSGRVKVWEHKTAASITTRHLSLDDQAGTYWAMANTTLQREGILRKGEWVDGIEYNFLRKALPDDRPRDAEGYHTNKPVKADYVEALGDVVAAHSAPTLAKLKLESLEEIARGYGLMVLGSRSKIQPPPLFLRHQVWRTRPERKNQMLRLQSTILQMELHRDGTLPVIKNPTRECSWCQFFDICELDERGGDWHSLRDIAFVRQDPYADHRKSTDE